MNISKQNNIIKVWLVIVPSHVSKEWSYFYNCDPGYIFSNKQHKYLDDFFDDKLFNPHLEDEYYFEMTPSDDPEMWEEFSISWSRELWKLRNSSGLEMENGKLTTLKEMVYG